jgi:hypothetical protein
VTDDAVQHQAEALAAYLSRGGAATRWLDSKDLAPADRGRILVALTDLLDDTGWERQRA